MAASADKQALWNKYVAAGKPGDWAAYQKSNGLSTSQPETKPKTPQQMGRDVAAGADEWNERAQDLGQKAEDARANDPTGRVAEDFIRETLGGEITRNPWEQGLHGDIGTSNQDEVFQLLRDYLGGGAGSQTPEERRAGQRNYAANYSGMPGTMSGGAAGAGGGGIVPDTVGGQNTFFAQKIRELFDPSRLDPANDPTMKPYIDSLQNEASEDYLRNLAVLDAQAEGAGRYGSGLYQAMRGQQTEEQQEAITNAIAQAMFGSREAALGRQMEGLGLTNVRDISAMNDMTQRAGIAASAAAASGASGAAMADAAEGRKLQAIGMLMQGKQFELGMRGDMAAMRQAKQMGSLEGALGYGQLGLSGIQTALSAGELGLGSLGLKGNVAQALFDADMRMKDQNWTRRMDMFNSQQDALNDYMNIIMGFGGMGGTTVNPGSYLPSGTGSAGAAAAGLGAGLGAAGAWGSMGGFK